MAHLLSEMSYSHGIRFLAELCRIPWSSLHLRTWTHQTAKNKSTIISGWTKSNRLIQKSWNCTFTQPMPTSSFAVLLPLWSIGSSHSMNSLGLQQTNPWINKPWLIKEERTFHPYLQELAEHERSLGLVLLLGLVALVYRGEDKAVVLTRQLKQQHTAEYQWQHHLNNEASCSCIPLFLQVKYLLDRALVLWSRVVYFAPRL